MAKTRGDYELETGLFGGGEAAIVDAYFEPNPRIEYQQVAGSDPGLTLILQSTELENPIEQWYSCGGKKQWQVGRGGSEINSAVNPDSHRFNMNSKAGILVTRMFEAIGGGDKAKGQDFFLKRDRYMTEAEFYTGLNFVWEQKSTSYNIDGQIKEGTLIVPAKYLGEVAPGKKEAAVAEAPTGDLDTIVIGMVSGLTEREVKMAAMKVKALKENDAYMKELISGSKLKNLEDAGRITPGPEETGSDGTPVRKYI